MQMDSDLEAPLGSSDWVPYYNISHTNILTITNNNNTTNNNNSIDEEKAELEMIGMDKFSQSFTKSQGNRRKSIVIFRRDTPYFVRWISGKYRQN